MRMFATIDRRDRRFLLVSAGLALVFVVILALLSPPQDDDNTTPSSYSSGTHGALAAYRLLEQSGYTIERWGGPLDGLANRDDSHITLIVAGPYATNLRPARAPVAKFLERGGHVLVTGNEGGRLMPGNEVVPNPAGVECAASPNGFDRAANSGEVHMGTGAVWRQTDPMQRVQYTCEAGAVVVTYAVGKGQVTWWASSLPLENAGIQQGDNLALLLNSIGPSSATRVEWDESLHGEAATLWSYAEGTPIHLVWWQLTLVASLMVLSYSRRSGPLRPDPVVSRANPIEFVRSLGALYHKAHATDTVVAIAYHHFKHVLLRYIGLSHSEQADAEQIAAAVERRFGGNVASLKRDLADCEATAYGETISVNRALGLVQRLRDHETWLQNGCKDKQT
jgi:hypothetical protein